MAGKKPKPSGGRPFTLLERAAVIRNLVRVIGPVRTLKYIRRWFGEWIPPRRP